MCDVCGCNETRKLAIEVHTPLLARNDAEAAHLRAHFAGRRLTTLNVMGSPGAGKTALLEATSRAFAGRARLAAVSGDLATENDAARLRRAGIPSLSITTGTGCHLDAHHVHDVLHAPALAPALAEADYFFVENVGNLVCPALFDLGQAANVVLLSVTEGVDKPEKYPVMFRHADLVLLSKADLLPHLPEVSVEAVAASLARVAPGVRLLPVSARTGEGVPAFVEWLETLRAGVLSRSQALAAPDHTHPGHAPAPAPGRD
jgi:hydrogenase nickel incorporation protein HypB